ncbi:Ctf8-domain-containing protein [Irpex rosettiformis]|uniref:Ctf8-domain-containing protein n=1 Tax=Irpex rosettiformis TaxID=378272 RepID=A0ACB8U9B6_9APHY|nr:Ctf8-domain-containing protein [Irpex rosettiformis]
MIIPINIATSSAGPTLPPQLAKFGTDELVLIELQGSLDVEGEISGQLVGKLDLETDPKKPTLLIGHHLLEGKLQNLAKPLAVMHKNSRESSKPGGEMVQEVDSSSSTEWDIVAVVRRKMVFTKRPMPMVGRVPVTTDTIR